MYDTLNYRGMSLLPCIIAKLYSSILNNRLTQYRDYLEIIVDEQNRFVKTDHV